MSAKRTIRTEEAPEAIGPYSQGVGTGELVFTSGQLPMTASGELIVDDIGEATRQSLANVLSVLRAAGAGPEDVIKVTIFLKDLADFSVVNAVYGEAFAEPYPARSCVEVSRLPKDAPIEIEAVARVVAGSA